jgi:hypothetical protein
MHSRRRLEVFRRTNSASTICLAMSWIGMKIAGTPTIAARLLMARRGSLETVVGALCVAVPGTLISASSARLTAAGSPRPIGPPPSGSAWPEHSSYIFGRTLRGRANLQATEPPEAFSGRIAETCGSCIIIVTIMKLWNDLSRIRVLRNSGCCGFEKILSI